MRYDAATALRIDPTFYCERPDPKTPCYTHRQNMPGTMQRARTERIVLDALRSGPKTQMEIIEITGIKRATVLNVLNAHADLDEPNVRSWPDPLDGRRLLYALT